MRHTSITSGSVKLRDGINDERELVVRQILMHGQRDRRIGVTVRYWKVSVLVAEVAQPLLAIKRYWIMDLALDAAGQAMLQ